MRKILLVDDDPHILSALQRALLQLWHGTERPQIECFTNPFEALNRICVCEFDVVICDYMMPQMSGGELLQALRDVAPDTVRIMLSGSPSFDTMLSAINEAQAFRFLRKPWDANELADSLHLALEQRAALLAARAPAPVAPSPQELEARRLEAEEPGLLTVRRDADGSVIL
ncbi:response regulator [Pseudoduganella chitinolytica]|uniref:Response regulator n=1 Tax=Pseudoduganella chitinolytica TaxID=34070 RepID=A0ABY8BFU0_9BURK|nr:response regulator [Pseudoduganella chitinolytica]WEF34769.1 response regulator [Pseudoduganella chitinolytica]